MHGRVNHHVNVQTPECFPIQRLVFEIIVCVKRCMSFQKCNWKVYECCTLLHIYTNSQNTDALRSMPHYTLTKWTLFKLWCFVIFGCFSCLFMFSHVLGAVFLLNLIFKMFIDAKTIFNKLIYCFNISTLTGNQSTVHIL